MHRKKLIAMILTAALAASMTMPAMAATDTHTIPSVYTADLDLSDLSAISSDAISVDSSDPKGATILTIQADGSYRFTGNAKDISIVIKKGVTATLVFDDMTIDDSGYANADPGDDDAVIEAVINCKKNSIVNLVFSGNSTIKCNADDSYMENGIKHAKADGNTLTFSGSGGLTISGSADDAVKYKGGTVSIESGSLTIDDCYGDGIQAENIEISGGTTNITTSFANASESYYGSGSSAVDGANTIWETGQNTKYERVNVDTGSHKALKGGSKAKTSNYKDGTESASTEASGGIQISGGIINIDTTAAGLKANGLSTDGYTKTSSGVYIIGSPDDGIHSNNSLSISGGDIHIAASDDAITAAGDLTISQDASIDITSCYEGIEGRHIVIGQKDSMAGPSISIQANDDGINAASKTLTYTYDSSEDEDVNYLKQSVSSDDNSCIIYSGRVTIDIDSSQAKTVSLAGKTISYTASGDGIDCNGTLDIEGGTVYVFGQSSGDNSPIDTDKSFTLSDQATVLAAGCDAMGETAPSAGSASYLVYTGTADSVTAQKAGSASAGNMDGRNSGPGGGFENNANNDDSADGSRANGNPGQGGFDRNGNSGGPGGGFGGNGNLGGPGGGFGGNASISAGTVFTVTDGTQTLISETLPHASSYVLFASPDLTADNSYTISGSTQTGDNGSDNTGGNTGQVAVSKIPAQTYTGKAIKPAVDVTAGGKTLKAGTDYTVSYSNNKNVGTARLVITFKGSYSSQKAITKSFRIKKAQNTLTLKKNKKTYTAKELKKSKKTFRIRPLKAKGTLRYTLSKAAKKAGIRVGKSGKVTIPKNCKAGTYQITVKASGTGNYAKGSQTFTITVKSNTP